MKAIQPSPMVRFFALSSLIVLSAASAKAIPIFGIGTSNNLLRFDSTTPGTITSLGVISGMIEGDTIVGLDFRPLDGRLYGLGSGGRLYVIDPATRVATQVGTGTFAVPLTGSAWGFDFNPVVDRIRVVSNAEQNFRLNPDTGTVVDGDPATAGIQGDTNLDYAAGDPNDGVADTNIVSAAYTNNTPSATGTGLFGLDSVQNVLVRQGGVNVPPDSPSPNSGQLFTVGPLGVDPTSAAAFDIATGSGTGFAIMVVSAAPRLYTINLSTGAATQVGFLAGGTTVNAMAVAISGFTAALSGTTATFTGSVAGNSIVFDQSGGLLRHNRFSNGDTGFASDFDFNTAVANDQTLSATNAAVTVIVNAGDRDDQVTIGTAAVPASGLLGAFQINGQGGGDSLVINDSAGTTARTINVNGATSTVSGLGGSITYGTLESLTVNAGSGADTVNVSGPAAALTSINTAGGADTVNFGNGASLSGGLLDGGVGADTVDYNAYTTPVTVDLNETQVLPQGTFGTATGSGGVRDFENVTGGSGADLLTGAGGVNILHGGGNDDVLVGGPGGDQLFGDSNNDRLIWNNGDGSDLMEGGPGTDTVEVNGSPSGDDQFLIQVNPADAARLRFDRTNLGLFNLNIGTTEALDFNTLGGNDTTTVDFAGGNPIPSSGIDFAGGSGNDRLVLQRSSGTFAASSTTHTATGPGAGTINVDGSGITFTGLEPVDDTVPATTFTFFAPLSSTRIQVVNGPTVDGVATTQINDGGSGAFELVNFARKTDVFINSGTSGQELLINNSVAPPNLSTLIFNTTPANDEINILAVPPGVVTTVNSVDGLDLFAVTGAGVPGGATLLLNSNLGFDQLIYDSGGVGIDRIAGPNAGQTTITRPGSGTVIYRDFESVLFDGIARALNIATRLRVLTGDNALIGGFIIPGGTSKRVIVRAIGPSLGQFGLTGLLADPTLELYDSLGQLTASNDNWRATQEGEIIGTGIPPQNELEAALVVTLAPGAHTVVVRGKDNGSGIGVVEAYDLEPNTFAQFANISTRGFVDAGDNVMIGGFILGADTGSAHVAIRGIGPSLAQLGIANALADPTLDLYDANGTRLIFNDNWTDDSAQAAALNSSGLAPSSNEESGIFTILPPGAYTAILAGKNGGIGVGLVEVYNLQ